MHGHDFLIDADVNAPGQVSSPSTLNIGISDGIEVNNINTIGANRLLIFTGTAQNSGIVGHDDNIARGVFRVRLRFALAQTVIFKAAATIAALAGLHGEEDEDQTFAADAAVTVTDPTDGGTLPQTVPPLPDNELYTIIDAAYQGDGCILTRVSYQANVLVQDLEPDLESILVRPSGGGDFGPSVTFELSRGQNASYDFQVNLTGPVPQGPFFGVGVESDDNTHVPLGQLVVINSPDSSTMQLNNPILRPFQEEIATLTATAQTAKQTKKTATVVIRFLT